MKTFLLSLVFFRLTLSLLPAQGPDEQYITIYSSIQQGDTLNQSGSSRAALEKYINAQNALKRLQAVYPNWNEKVVKFRLNYLSEKISPLLAQFPSTNLTSGVIAGVRSDRIQISSELETKIRTLETQVRQLSQDKELLEAKLKESFAVRPADLDPRQMAKAENRINELTKENDLLKITLDQQKTKSSQAAHSSMEMQGRFTEVTQQLAHARAEVAAIQKNKDLWTQEKSSLQAQLKELAGNQTATASQKTALEKEISETKAILAAHNQQVVKLEAEKSGLQETISKLNASTKAQDLEKQMLQLKEQLASLNKSQATLRDEKANLEKQVANANKTQNTSGELKSVLEKELGEAKKTASSQQAEIRRLQSEKSDLEKRLRTDTSTASNINSDRTRELTRDLTAARLALQVKESTLQSLQAEKKTFINRLKELSLNKVSASLTNTSVLEKQLLEAKAASQKKEIALNELQKEKSALEAKVQALTVETKPAATPVIDKALERELEKARSDMRKKEEDLQKISREKSELEKKLALVSPSGDKGSNKLKKLEEERDDLQKQLNSLNRELANARNKAASGKSANLQQEVETLRSRLSILEAQAIPYHAEELALFKKPETRLASADPKSGKKSVKELPAGAGPLVAEAERAFAARRFEEAESKYLQVLRQDEKNVYTLANLAAIEMELKRVDMAEKYLKQALALDPDDAYSLALMGIVRFQQNKVDEALEALSRSAKINPQSAETQNYLGIALSQKGQRKAAEAALRKALHLQPGYASAHHNLAVIYATQKPAFPELARWHYDKAIAGGHSKNEELEKLIPAK